MPAKIHAIAKELMDAFGIKRGAKDSDAAFAKKLHGAATECEVKVWESLSEEAQGWVNGYSAAAEANKGMPKDMFSAEAIEWLDTCRAAEEAKEELPDFGAEEAAEKPASGRRPSAKEEKEPAPKARRAAASKAPANGKPEGEALAPPKARRAASAKEAKAPAKAPAKAAGKAPENSKRGTSESPGFTPEWGRVLRDLGKKGKDGIDTKGMAALCEKHGTRPFYNRFLNAGYIERVSRGQFALTKDGQRAVDKPAA